MVRILFFASDISEIAQRRRIRSFRALGHVVASLGMQKRAAEVDWPHISLGQIVEERLWRRLTVALLALPRLWRQRHALATVDLIIARNLDMVVLALIARAFAGRRVPVVYECLDVHGLMTRGGLGALARWVERRALARVALLVVSSPGFISQYFVARQGYAGPWHLLENKLALDVPPPPRPLPKHFDLLSQRKALPLAKPRTCFAFRGDLTKSRNVIAERPGEPLVLGWVGAIRCPRSFALLLEAADALPDTLEIRVNGTLHDHAIPGFAEAVAQRLNIRFCGAYAYPEGLAAAYAGLDLVWAQDLWQGGANSDWLLPNRIYEASWFGCPSLAVAGTETGRRVTASGLGFTLAEPTAEALIGCLQRLSPDDILACRKALLARPDQDFRQAAGELESVVERALFRMDCNNNKSEKAAA